jgi:hypothetical protein
LTLKGDSTAESHAREFLAKSFCFGRICRLLETISEFKERCSPLFIRGDRIRQEIDDGTIRGDVPAHRDGVDLLSHLCGERNAPSDGFGFCKSRFHGHQDTPNYTKSQIVLHQIGRICCCPLTTQGRNLAESYYLVIPALSWQNIVLGDPLCSLGKP